MILRESETKEFKKSTGFYRPKWDEGEGLEKGGQIRWSEKVVRN